MIYENKELAQLQDSFNDLQGEYERLLLSCASFNQTLNTQKAKEFIVHGVCRRLTIIYRCMINIFRIFPPEKESLLPDDDRSDVQINLHAFIINIFGILENLALSFAHENQIIGKRNDGKLHKNDIGLFKSKFQSRLPDNLQTYLESDRIEAWYDGYEKNYRDALAHRIPPFIPPSGLNEAEQQEYSIIEKKIAEAQASGNVTKLKTLLKQQKQLGKANPIFAHSFSEDSKPMYLHAQILADFATIEQLIEVYIGIEPTHPIDAGS